MLVASGIGITPAMSIVTSLKQSRRTHLIWACRDAALLEFYLDKCIFDTDAWTLVYYTGKRKLVLPPSIQPTVLIFYGRPNFDCVVREVVVGTELGTGLPERVVAEAEDAIGAAREYTQTLDTSGCGPTARFSALIRRELRARSGDVLLQQIKARLLAANHAWRGRDDHAGATLTRDEFAVAVNSIVYPDTFDDAEVDALIRQFDADGSGDVDVDELLGACRAAIGLAMLGSGRDSAAESTLSKAPRNWALRNFRPGASTRRKRVGLRRPSQGYDKVTSATDEPSTPARPGGPHTAADPVTSTDPNVFVDAVGVERLASWGIFYCGGSQAVVDALTTIEMRYGIGLSVEKFDW